MNIKSPLSLYEIFSNFLSGKSQKNVSLQNMSKEDLKKIEDENSKKYFAPYNEISEEDRSLAKERWDRALDLSFYI